MNATASMSDSRLDGIKPGRVLIALLAAIGLASTARAGQESSVSSAPAGNMLLAQTTPAPPRQTRRQPRPRLMR